MRFLHTSDWHIGKTLRGRTRHEEERAVLAEVLDIARSEQIDCLLVAGDIYDKPTPPSEAERIVYDFFRRLKDSDIPAVVIAGNHDDSRRLIAVSRVLELANIHVRGEATRDGQNFVRLRDRDGSDEAVIATLPWVPERKAVDWESYREKGRRFDDYASGLREAAQFVCRGFSERTVNLFVGHLMVEGAVVGPGGGERQLHISEVYAVPAESLVHEYAHYLALGHLHGSQEVKTLVPCRYSGSLLQLDFGEREQQKVVQIVDASPGRPASVEAIPITSGRSLREVRGNMREIEAQASEVGDDYLKVIVSLEPNSEWNRPAVQVKEWMPNAVDIRIDLPAGLQAPDIGEEMKGNPLDLFAEYYKLTHDAAGPPEEIRALFRKLLEELANETS